MSAPAIVGARARDPLVEVGDLGALEVALDVEDVARGGLYAFLRLAWPHVETSPFVDGWHLQELCAHLEAVHRGEVRRLVIAVPPGTTKSLTTCVMWPTWCWIDDPALRWCYWSNDLNLVLRDARKQRDLIASDWFQARWGHRVRLDAQVDAARRADRADSALVFYTAASGMRFSTTPKGKAIGWHFHRHVGDDPHKPLDAYSPGELDLVDQWHSETLSTRAVDRSTLAQVVQQQRIAQNDLAGRCIERGWEALVLPMRYDPDRRCRTRVGGDRRSRRGELLCPGRYDEAAEAELRRALGSHAAAAQLDQDPRAPGGQIYRREQFRRYRALPRERGVVVDSWDLTFGASQEQVRRRGEERSYVAGQRWVLFGRDAYLVLERRGQWDYARARAEVRALAETPGPYGRPVDRVLVENKANGPAIESDLRGEVRQLELVEPRGSKEARARAVQPDVEAGRVYVPDAPWVEDWLAEVERFPGKPNDRGDAMTQALACGGRDSGSALLRALAGR